MVDALLNEKLKRDIQTTAKKLFANNILHIRKLS